MQMDGASDNVNFTNINFFCWFLLLMKHLGYPLRHVHLCRLMVGHTHNDVDMRHSLSSQARIAQEPNLWSFTAFKKWLMKVHSNELKEFWDVHQVYDFKSWLNEMRHDSDTKISTWMHVHLEVRDDGTVWARSKPRMGRKVPWDTWSQYFPPPPPVDHGHTCPEFDSKPTARVNHPWKNGDKVIRSLRKAYDPLARHAKLIPDVDRVEMLEFLSNGPGDVEPPGWFKFLDRQPIRFDVHSSSTTTNRENRIETAASDGNESVWSTFDNVFGSDTPVVSDHNIRYEPIGVSRSRAAATAATRSTTGKRCRCGSVHHLRTNHRRCPLNPRNRPPPPRSPDSTSSDAPPITRNRRTRSHSSSSHTNTDSDSDSPYDPLDENTMSDSESSSDILLDTISNRVKQVRVGSKIAKFFGLPKQLYIGEVVELPTPPDTYYSVVYGDGDSETMKLDEVLECIDLFNEHKK